VSSQNWVALLGEVQTGLVQNSAALSVDMAADLVRLSPGEPVLTRSRPVEIARSTDQLTGVDCLAPGVNGRRRRMIGTVRSTVSIIDGQLLQIASCTQIRTSDLDRRQPWSHYLANPGTLDLLGPPAATVGKAIARGFLTPAPGVESLNLTGLNNRLRAGIQRSDRLDHQVPFSARRARLRWSAWLSQRAGQHAELTIGPDDLRTLQLELPASVPLVPLAEAIGDFCALLARHDWLLTTLREKADRVLRSRRPRTGADLDALREVHLVVIDLAHTWIPPERIDPRLAALWEELEAQAGTTAQWSALVDRIRDAVQNSLLQSLSGVPEPPPERDCAEPGGEAGSEPAESG
jgi:hypothetical protein